MTNDPRSNAGIGEVPETHKPTRKDDVPERPEPLADVPGKPLRATDDNEGPSKGDAQFLTESFGMSAGEAARSLTGTDAPEAAPSLAAELRRESAPSLRGKPTPDEPASDLTTDTDEERLKPVLRQNNDRAGP